MKIKLYANLLVLSLLKTSIAHATFPVKDLNAYFGKNEGCLVIQNLNTGKNELVHGGRACSRRVFACSTFKIPLAVIAADQKLITDLDTFFKWDGQDKGLEAWNRDHTAKSWMSDSVVWVSQELSPKIGMKAFKKYLKDFKYGNQDMSGGVTKAWLSSTLKISPYEQVDFLRRLWRSDLDVSSQSIDLTQKLTYVDTSAAGAILHGKTGSGFGKEYRIGWYVGYLKNGKNEYVFALNFRDSSQPMSKEFAGREAREILKKILHDIGLF